MLLNRPSVVCNKVYVIRLLKPRGVKDGDIRFFVICLHYFIISSFIFLPFIFKKLTVDTHSVLKLLILAEKGVPYPYMYRPKWYRDSEVSFNKLHVLTQLY